MNAERAFAFTLNKASTQNGDVRSMLLKLSVEQFIEIEQHSKAEAEQFGELAIGFLQKSSLLTQMEMAEKLVHRADLPENLFEFLVNSDSAIAALFIAQSPKVDAKKIKSLAENAESETLAAIARRPKISLKTIEALVERKDMVSLAALIENETITLPANSIRKIVAALAEEPKVLRRLMARPEAAALSPLDFFLDAPSEMRLSALEELVDFEAEVQKSDMSPLSKAVIAGIESAALARTQSHIIEAIKQALGLSTATASRIVLDASGEPLALILRAIGAPREVIERVLIFGAAGEMQKTHSLAQLMDIVEHMPVQQAREMLSKLIEGAAGENFAFTEIKTKKKRQIARS